MSTMLKKDYSKTKPLCKVTFSLPLEAAQGGKEVRILGDFNGWSWEKGYKMKAQKAEFTTEVELAAGKEYQFRYLIDNHIWENDWNADSYQVTPFGEYNSVISLREAAAAAKAAIAPKSVAKPVVKAAAPKAAAKPAVKAAAPKAAAKPVVKAAAKPVVKAAAPKAVAKPVVKAAAKPAAPKAAAKPAVKVAAPAAAKPVVKAAAKPATPAKASSTPKGGKK